MEPQHAVESPTGTFIVSLYNRQLTQGQVVEVNNVGEVLRKSSSSFHLIQATRPISTHKQTTHNTQTSYEEIT